MRYILKKILIYLLRLVAKRILMVQQPEVVGITGSVGKTSTKEAIFTVLASHLSARRNYKSYNNEIGVPLSIIGIEQEPGRSLIKWTQVFMKALVLMLKRYQGYPRVLVLEMGADHPGDIDYLTSFVRCKVGVITAIAPVHIEFFKKIENILAEKKILLERLPEDGFAVVNGDDSIIMRSLQKIKANILTFGFRNKCDVRASDIRFSSGSKDDGVMGISFKLSYQGHVVPVFMPGVLGKHQVYAALAAAAVGVVFGLNLVQISEALKTFHPPRGRMNLVEGIKGSFIIDDSYNSSPTAAKAALEVLKEMSSDKQARSIAVLGDMLELGAYTEQGHREVGHRVAELRIDYLICIGARARYIGHGAEEAGMDDEKIYYFSHIEEASRFVQELIRKGDFILVKGSQGMRMERVVKEIMAHPELADKLLVRQDPPWV